MDDELFGDVATGFIGAAIASPLGMAIWYIFDMLIHVIR